MDDQLIMNEVEQICRTTFKNNQIRLAATTTAVEVDGWDSLSHVMLIHNVERHFKIKIAIREAVRLENVGALVSLIRRKAA
jgi:acyl carrier protein